MNFDCNYIIILTANKASRFTESYAWATGTQVFFETPSVLHYCDIIQYMFLFMSVSVNMSLSPSYNFYSVTLMIRNYAG